MTKSFTLAKALVLQSCRQIEPVITAYRLGLLVFNAYCHKSVDGQPLQLKKEVPGRTQYNAALKDLLSLGV